MYFNFKKWGKSTGKCEGIRIADARHGDYDAGQLLLQVSEPFFHRRRQRPFADSGRRGMPAGRGHGGVRGDGEGVSVGEGRQG